MIRGEDMPVTHSAKHYDLISSALAALCKFGIFTPSHVFRSLYSLNVNEDRPILSATKR